MIAVSEVAKPAGTAAIWIERITLTGFRNYAHFAAELQPTPVVLTGPNGAGKTNLLEAVSLLAPGLGLRRVSFQDLAIAGGDGSWAVAARLHASTGPVDIGTGLVAGAGGSARSGRVVRINGETQGGSGALADLVEMLWLTPAMDGLFTGAASDRRRFLDRLTLCFDPGYRTRLGQFERAMQQRNRLLADGVRDAQRFNGLEQVMAETGVAVAAARVETVGQLAATIEARRQRAASSPFPWASVALAGTLDTALGDRPAVEVEDSYIRLLASGRERDRAAGRTLEGPHRSDLVVAHGPKQMPAELCSTGEQKALLVGLILAHAELLRHKGGFAPILLLDEIAAHLDEARRGALFDEILMLGSQAWMTGTDASAFAALARRAQHFRVDGGFLSAL